MICDCACNNSLGVRGVNINLCQKVKEDEIVRMVKKARRLVHQAPVRVKNLLALANDCDGWA